VIRLNPVWRFSSALLGGHLLELAAADATEVVHGHPAVDAALDRCVLQRDVGLDDHRTIGRHLVLDREARAPRAGDGLRLRRGLRRHDVEAAVAVLIPDRHLRGRAVALHVGEDADARRRDEALELGRVERGLRAHGLERQLRQLHADPPEAECGRS
jgi:hypothetical protein